MPQYIHANPKREINQNTLEVFWKSNADIWVKMLFIYLYYFGVRISEAISVKAEDFEIIERDGEKYIRVYSLTLKNPSQDERVLHVWVGEPYIIELMGYVKNIKQGRLFPYTREWSRKSLQKVIPWITPHGFRHNRLNTFAQAGETPYALKSWAGWSDVRPGDTYTQLVDTLKMAQRKHT